jgi:xylulokinase
MDDIYSVGIDLGTTGCKAVVADRRGNIAGEDYIEYPLIFPGEHVEQDAGLWWELTCRAVESAVTKSAVKKENIKGICAASQGISFVMTDAELSPLGSAVSWLDTRAKKEAGEIKKNWGEWEIFAKTGKRPNEAYVLPKLMWLKKHKKSEYKNARKILMAHDFITAKMTGNSVTDHTMAGGTLLYDITKRRWSPKIAHAFDIDTGLLPSVKESGSSAGALSPEAAKMMGLPLALPVAVGGQDQKAAAYFALLGKKAATLCLGTAGAMEFIVSKPVFDKKMRLPLFPFIEEGKWTLESVISTAGAALKWYRNTFFEDTGYGVLDEAAKKGEPGSGGVFFYPHFGMASSPHWQSGQKGAFYGLMLNTPAEHMTRSVLEGIAFQIKQNLDICELLSEKTDDIIVFGGGSQSALWCRIIADITGKTIQALPCPDAAAQGAAMLALKNHGVVCRAGGGNLTRYAPEIETFRKYREIYREYREIEKKLLSPKGGRTK